MAGDPADLFAFKINYNKVENCLNYTGTPLYNGNIAETYWRSSSDNILRKYGYKYDNLNRLRQAIYQKPGLAVPVTNLYNEALSYDKNGNITSLSRNGYYDNNNGEIYNIDKLNYGYTRETNQLYRVDDESNSLDGFKDVTEGQGYEYDANGNLIGDYNKSMEIAYNHLNLPAEVRFVEEKITYIYNAAGEKVSRIVENDKEATTTLYEDGFQYINDVLQFFPTSEGYVNVVKEDYNYVYNYTDHLGNIRMSFLKEPGSGATRILEESNYYPFGLKHENYNSEKYELAKSDDGSVSIILKPTDRNVYQYKYNGKELQDELGLNMYDYGARLYDPARAGWTTIDPLAEQMRRWSPYNYCFDNPLIFTDPDGMGPWPSWASVKSFAKGFVKSAVAMSEGANPIKMAYNQVKSNIRAAKSVAKGDFKGALNELANQTGIPSLVTTAKKAGSGDPEAIGNLTAVVVVGIIAHKAGGAKASAVAEAEVTAVKAPVTNEIYQRPNNATTPAQRASVQGKPCVDCGATSEPMVADHKTPLVQEHYETGTIDTENMRSLDAVQPQCTTCSAKQGAEMSQYSKEMKAKINERTSD